MKVGDLKAELDNYGDHLEVVADDNARVMTNGVLPIARVVPGQDQDGMSAVVLELE